MCLQTNKAEMKNDIGLSDVVCAEYGLIRMFWCGYSEDLITDHGAESPPRFAADKTRIQWLTR